MHSIIFHDIYALRLLKRTFIPRTMQNTAKGLPSGYPNTPNLLVKMQKYVSDTKSNFSQLL